MKKSRGFNLIELMITVVVIAVIASIAYPSYQEQIRKTRRADAKAALMDAAAKMERNYTQFGRYSATIANVGIAATSPGNFYRISVANPNSQTFTLTATRDATTDQATDRCGDFAIDQAQRKSVANNALTSAQCGWP
jgi:type IV pilus assembly protein PilE